MDEFTRTGLNKPLILPLTLSQAGFFGITKGGGGGYFARVTETRDTPEKQM